MNWYLQVLRKYAVFSGRAGRREYWYFFLFNFIIGVVLGAFDRVAGSYSAQTGLGLLGTIYSLAVLIPSLAVTVRRLHDVGRSGWWLLINLVPVLGFFVLLYFALLDSEPGVNRYGANPKQTAA